MSPCKIVTLLIAFSIQTSFGADDVTLKQTIVDVVHNSKDGEEYLSLTERYANSSTGEWLILHGTRKKKEALKSTIEKLAPSEVLYGSSKTASGFFGYHYSLGGWMDMRTKADDLRLYSLLFEDPNFRKLTSLGPNIKDKSSNIGTVLKLLSSVKTTEIDDSLHVELNDEKSGTIFHYEVKKDGEIVVGDVIYNGSITQKVINEHLADFDLESYRKTIHTSDIPKRKYFMPLETLLKNKSPQEIFGYKLGRKGNRLIIERIFVNSPAGQSGLKPGMEILQIAGISASNIHDIQAIADKAKALPAIEIIALAEDRTTLTVNLTKTAVGNIAVDNFVEVDEIVP